MRTVPSVGIELLGIKPRKRSSEVFPFSDLKHLDRDAKYIFRRIWNTIRHSRHEFIEISTRLPNKYL